MEADSSGKRDLNAAGSGEIVDEIGISRELAEEIVRVRDQRGGFTDLMDVEEIPHVTMPLIERLRERFYIAV